MPGDVGSAIEEIARGIVIAVVSIIVLGAVVNAAGSVLADGSDTGETGTIEIATEPTVGAFVDVPDIDDAYGASAAATLENALYFDGNATAESGEPTNMSRGSWSACAVAELDSSANQNDTYTVAAYENATILVQFDAGDWAVYFNNTTRSGMARIDATSPTTETAVCARWNESHLIVSRNATISSGVALTSSTTSRNVTRNWTGTLDEVRTFNSSISDNEIQTYAGDPITPLPGTNRSTRWMFDEGSGGTTRDYVSDTDATIYGTSWTSGVAKPSISEGTDYEVRASPLEIKVLSGGYLDGAPVVWVVADSENPWYPVISTITNYGTTAFTLLGLGLIALGATFAISRLELGSGSGGR